MRTAQDTFALCDLIKFPGLRIECAWFDGDLEKNIPDDYRLRVACPEGKCNVTGNPMPWNGRWWRLSKHMTDSEIVWTAWKAVLTALEHEAREQFTFKGVPIADSHVDVHKLADFMAQPSVKDGRDHHA